MLSSFLAKLSLARESSVPLASVKADELRALLVDPLLEAGLDRVRDTDYKTAETGALYDDGKSVEVFRDRSWRVIFSRHSVDSQFINTVPHPSLMYCVEGDGSCILRRFKVEGDLADPLTASEAGLVEKSATPIYQGLVFSFEDWSEAIELEGKTKNYIFLRIMAGPEHPLAYSFTRDTRKFAFKAFSDDVLTGRSFYTAMVKELVASRDFSSSLPSEEKDSLGRFFAAEALDASLPSTTRWQMLQIVGRAAPRLAPEILALFENDGDPLLAEQAARHRDAKVPPSVGGAA